MAEKSAEASKGAELHIKFSETILKAIPKSVEKNEGKFSAIKVKDLVVCFIRDKQGPSIANKLYNNGKATTIEKETTIPTVVAELAKNYQKKEKR